MKTIKKIYWILLILPVILTSCFRLDSNLFAPEVLDDYMFDNADPETWNFVAGSEFDIADSMISLMILPSKLESEAVATDIYAVYLGDIGRIATDTVIVYCHGNSSNMDHYWQRAKLLANVGGKHRYGVMMMDYRGYGKSAGSSTEESMYRDVETCMDWLGSQGLSGDRTVMYGYSMGTAPATELTANPRGLDPAMVILEAPFASAEVMAQDGSGLAIPGSFFTNLKIDNAEEIKKVDKPFLWLHGIDDDYLSYERHGEVVWKNYSGSRGEKISVADADHSDVPFVLGQNTYIESIENFITGN